MEKSKSKYYSFRDFSVDLFGIFFGSWIFYSFLVLVFPVIASLVIVAFFLCLGIAISVYRSKKKFEKKDMEFSKLEAMLKINSRKLADSEKLIEDLQKMLFHQKLKLEARDKEIIFLKESMFEEYESFKESEIKIAELQELYEDKKREAYYFRCLADTYEREIEEYRHAKEYYSKIYQSGYKPDLFDKCSEQSLDCLEILHCYVCPKNKKYSKKRVRKRMKIKKRISASPDDRLSAPLNSTIPVPSDGR